jgi:hypothetical protein
MSVTRVALTTRQATRIEKLAKELIPADTDAVFHIEETNIRGAVAFLYVPATNKNTIIFVIAANGQAIDLS